jgi:hypothetical protein
MMRRFALSRWTSLRRARRTISRALKKVGNQLAGPLRSSYYFNPLLLKEPEVRTANRIVMKLARVQYLKQTKPREVSGGLPGLGRRRR